MENCKKLSLLRNELWNRRYIFKEISYIVKKFWYIQSLPKNPYRNKRTMGNKIEVSIVQGLDVQNFFKDVPNFLKNVPRVPKSVLE